MTSTPYYRYRCESCGVGLTAELAFRVRDRAFCPHCYAGLDGRPRARGTWVDAGMPVE